MTEQQKLFAVIMSLALMVAIVDLVRRRKLRIEYSWLWLFTGASIVTLVLRYDLLVLLSGAIGAVLPTTTLFIFALLFLMAMGIHFSMRISQLTVQQKNLAQELALMRFDLERRAGEAAPPA